MTGLEAGAVRLAWSDLHRVDQADFHQALQGVAQKRRALVVQAFSWMEKLESRSDLPEKLREFHLHACWMFVDRLVRRLYDAGFSVKQIVSLFRLDEIHGSIGAATRWVYRRIELNGLRRYVSRTFSAGHELPDRNLPSNVVRRQRSKVD